MIPITLTFEGVYSYQGRHSINFDKLVETGLFGVFGPVGSGKSSILEALTFALYGDTERLNSRGDNRNYNMMNLRSNVSLFDFEFYNHENEKYRIVRRYARNSKKFEEVNQRDATLYHWKDEEWHPLDHVNIEKIIGLSYNNFKRTIIIPQGKFREFIDLTGSQRTEMLKEIFNLYRFDLSPKLKGLYADTKSEYDKLLGQLENFEEINTVQLEEIEHKIATNEQSLLRLQNQQTQLDKEIRSLAILLKDTLSLKEKRTSFEKLKTEKNEMDKLASELREFEKVEKTFKQTVYSLLERAKKRTLLEGQKKQEIQTLEKLQQNGVKINNEFAGWEKKYKTLDMESSKLSELQYAVSIRKRMEDLEINSARLAKGEKAIEEKRAKLEKTLTLVKSTEAQLEQLKSNRLDTNEIVTVSQWYQQWNSLQQQATQLEKKIGELDKDITSINRYFSSHALSIEGWEKHISLVIKKCNSEIEKMESEKQHFLVQAKLSDYANSLKDGCPCPLCGSEDHPDIAFPEDVTKLIINVSDKLVGKKVELEKWQKTYRECSLKSEVFKKTSEELVNLKDELTELRKKQGELKSEFIWPQYKWDDSTIFEQKKSESQETEKRITQLDTLLSNARTENEKHREDLDKYNKGLQDIQMKLKQLQALNESEIEKIKLLNWDNLKSNSVEALQILYKNLETEIIDIQKNYNHAQDAKHTWEKNVESQSKTVTIYEKQFQELEQDIAQLNQQIEEWVELHHYPSKDYVLQTLDKKLDTADIRAKLDAFNIKYTSLHQQIKELEDKLTDVVIDENEYNHKVHTLELLKKEDKELTGTNASLKSELTRLKKQFDLKAKLDKEKEQMDYKLSNLSTLSNLMRGNGFVNYASGVWLDTIVSLANQRFHRMTKNQLSLKLNENNEFEVIDYLNEGKSRSVKTLSGGQTFQVSLSLALALAESVHSLSTAQRNFFFIDEGFGTQDPDSVSIIFETLNNLRKENRIVGVISHVDALQERIPASLNVSKTLDKGSIIRSDFLL